MYNQSVSNAFDSCVALKELIFPESLKSIGEKAFSGCTGLEKVSILGEMDYIGSRAFYNCSKLSTVIRGDYCVSLVFESAFEGCDNLLEPKEVIKYLTGLDFITEYYHKNGLLYKSYDGNMYYSLGGVASKDISVANIMQGCARIDYRAFEDCVELTELTLPASIKEIDSYAFYNCTSLTSIKYKGTLAQWKEIYKHEDWNTNSYIKKVICSDGYIPITQ